MATFTVSAAGGNWSSGTTWVGGVVPAAGDDIVANASSGNLTVDGNRTCLSINFTNYTNTFTINNGVTLTVTGVGATITLGGGMTYASGTTGVISTVGTNTAVTINFNGITIPRLTIGQSAVGSTQTVTINGTTPTVQNLISNSSSTSNASLSATLNITRSINVSGGGLRGSALNITGGQTVSATTSGNFTNNITVTSGTTLQMLSDLRIGGPSTVTFNVGSNLTTGNFALIPFWGGVGSATTVTLNTSVVEWYDITLITDQTVVQLTSDLNVANNIFMSNAGFATQVSILASGGTRNVNIKGSLTTMGQNPGILSNSSTIFNLIGTGTLAGRFNNTTINLNSSNPYTLGNATVNNLQLITTNLNLSGSTVATVFNSSHSLLPQNSTVNTNNTGIGGTQIIYANLGIPSGTATFTNETTFSGDATLAAGGFFGTLNGAKILVGGSLICRNISIIAGTSTIELIGSNNCNWGFALESGTYQNNITINKSGGATVSLLGNITWGLANRTLQRISGNISVGSSLVTIPNASVTINNMVFNNLTTTAGAIITQNSGNTVSGTITCNGSTTFSGTQGFTASTFNCTTAASNLTIQSGVFYNVTSNLFILGTNSSPILFSSSSLTVRSNFNLDYGATQTVYFVRATRIDSGLGQTIWNSFGTISNPLNDTINWNSGSKPAPMVYTFIT